MSIEQMASLKKIIAGFAAFGFILSFLTGIISGVLFGALLLRALLFAALFGGIGFAVTKFSVHFIPELFAAASENFDDMEESSIDEEDNNDSDPEEKISGKNLDITVEDEPDDDSETADTVEEVEDAEDAEDVEDVEELEEASEEPISDEKDSPEDTEAPSNGRLPDIGEFADTFERSDSDDTEVSSGLSNIDSAGERGVEVMGGMHDTQEITRAVQTILKRDQEG